MRNSVIRLLQKDQVSLSVIFDVGANVGQSIDEFSLAYPDAKIFAFEPAPDSYSTLYDKYAARNMVTLERVVLSCSERQVNMLANGESTSNRVVSKNDIRESVFKMTSSTGDSYMKKMGIESIDFLKIDTEGHDLFVLMGFIAALSSKNVKYIQVECSFSRANSYHAHFNDFVAFFENFGYGLYSINGLSNRLGRNRYSVKMYGDAIFCPLTDVN